MTNNNNTSLPLLSVSCTVCKDATPLYQCPRCGVRTCSLQCCLQHKKETGCNGKRDRTAFLRKEDMKDATIQSDYFFLEDILRTVDSGKRLKASLHASPHPKDYRPLIVSGNTTTKNTSSNDDTKRHNQDDNNNNNNNNNNKDTKDNSVETEQDPPRKRQRTDGSTNNKGNSNKSHHSVLPAPDKRLVEQASHRGITLMLMPKGMQRHEQNNTHYAGSKKTIFWKVEFVVHSAVESTKLHHPGKVIRIRKDSEQTLVGEIWKRANRNQHHRDESHRMDTFHFLLQRLPCSKQNAKYKEISPDCTLATALQGMTVYEHPTIEVVPSERLKDFPRLIVETTTTTDNVPVTSVETVANGGTKAATVQTPTTCIVPIASTETTTTTETTTEATTIPARTTDDVVPVTSTEITTSTAT